MHTFAHTHTHTHTVQRLSASRAATQRWAADSDGMDSRLHAPRKMPVTELMSKDVR